MADSQILNFSLQFTPVSSTPAVPQQHNPNHKHMDGNEDIPTPPAEASLTAASCTPDQPAQTATPPSEGNRTFAAVVGSSKTSPSKTPTQGPVLAPKMPKAGPAPRYTCVFCEKTFLLSATLNKHIMDVHDLQVTSEYSDTRATTPTRMMDDNEPALRRRSTTGRNAETHIQARVAPALGTFKSAEGPVKPATKLGRRGPHRPRQHGKLFKCDECRAVFYTAQTYKAHCVKSCHQQGLWKSRSPTLESAPKRSPREPSNWVTVSRRRNTREKEPAMEENHREETTLIRGVTSENGRLGNTLNHLPPAAPKAPRLPIGYKPAKAPDTTPQREKRPGRRKNKPKKKSQPASSQQEKPTSVAPLILLDPETDQTPTAVMVDHDCTPCCGSCHLRLEDPFVMFRHYYRYRNCLKKPAFCSWCLFMHECPVTLYNHCEQGTCQVNLATLPPPVIPTPLPAVMDCIFCGSHFEDGSGASYHLSNLCTSGPLQDPLQQLTTQAVTQLELARLIEVPCSDAHRQRQAVNDVILTRRAVEEAAPGDSAPTSISEGRFNHSREHREGRTHTPPLPGSFDDFRTDPDAPPPPLPDHENTRGGRASYECDHCGEAMKSFRELKTHKANDCRMIRLRCEFCTATAIGRMELRRHHQVECDNRRALELQARFDAHLITVEQINTGDPPLDPVTPEADITTDSQTPAITLNLPESLITFHFPFPSELTCPMKGCHAGCTGVEWTAIKHSIKRHLNRVHGHTLEDRNHCNVCNSPIEGKWPSKHHCLKFAIMRRVAPRTVEFVCDKCYLPHRSRKGLVKHLQERHREEVSRPQPTTTGPLAPLPREQGPTRLPVPVQVVATSNIPSLNHLDTFAAPSPCDVSASKGPPSSPRSPDEVVEVDSVHVCQACMHISPSRAAARRHFKVDCPKKRLRCPYCTFAVVGHEVLRNHIDTACDTRRRLEADALVLAGFIPGTDGKIHYQTNSPACSFDSVTETMIHYFPFPTEASCPIVGCQHKPFASLKWSSAKISLNRHFREAHSPLLKKESKLRHALFCNLCGLLFMGKPSKHGCLAFSQMRNTEPSSTRFTCNTCKRSFPSEKGLANHARVHIQAEALESGRVRIGGPAVITDHSIPLLSDARRSPSTPSTNPPLDKSSALPEARIQRPRYFNDSALTPFANLFDAAAEDVDPSSSFRKLCELSRLVVEKVQTTFRITPRVSLGSSRGPPRNPDDASYIQKRYHNNRRSAVRMVLDGPSSTCPIGRQEIFDHFSSAEPLPDLDADQVLLTPGVCKAPAPVNVDPFTPAEVVRRIKKFENSAPGPDGITYRQWLEADPEGTILTALFNLCLRLGRVPPDWKLSRSILIHKKGDLHTITNWRPICLASTISKIYSGLLAARLSTWLQDHEVLHPGQKGFLSHDGVLEHNFVLEQTMLGPRLGDGDAFAVWLDFADAFGSVRHDALLAVLDRYGVGPSFGDMVADMYKNSFTFFSTAQGDTSLISRLRGVMQGDPLSALLFNLTVDPLLWLVNPDPRNRCVMAYADDIVPFAKSMVSLQACIDKIVSGGAALGLKLNPSKCVSLHLSGDKPTDCRQTIFHIDGVPIRALKKGEQTLHLGKPIGFLHDRSSSSTVKQLRDSVIKVVASKLAPWQKLEALKTFIFPSFVFSYRTWKFPKTVWNTFDTQLRAELKKLLRLPSNAANCFLYGSPTKACLGLPILGEESDLFLIDSAFKLLSSKDPFVRELALRDLRRVIAKRVGLQNASSVSPADYLSGVTTGLLSSQKTNPLRCLWTEARKASSRKGLGVKWSFDSDFLPSITVPGRETSISPALRRAVAGSLRNVRRLERSDELCAFNDQGKTFPCLALDKASSYHVLTGYNIGFKDWPFIFKAWLNLLPTNHNKFQPTTKLCRRCHSVDETLPHIVVCCKSSMFLRKLRHNALVSRILKMCKGGSAVVLGVDQALSSIPSLRRAALEETLIPDAVVKLNGHVYLLDATIVFENGPEAFDNARARKIAKYQQLADNISRIYGPCSVAPFVVGALGGWDPGNNGFMRKFCSKSYATKFRRLACSSALTSSIALYKAHTSGRPLGEFKKEFGPIDAFGSDIDLGLELGAIDDSQALNDPMIQSQADHYDVSGEASAERDAVRFIEETLRPTMQDPSTAFKETPIVQDPSTDSEETPNVRDYFPIETDSDSDPDSSVLKHRLIQCSLTQNSLTDK